MDEALNLDIFRPQHFIGSGNHNFEACISTVHASVMHASKLSLSLPRKFKGQKMAKIKIWGFGHRSSIIQKWRHWWRQFLFVCNKHTFNLNLTVGLGSDVASTTWWRHATAKYENSIFFSKWSFSATTWWTLHPSLNSLSNSYWMCVCYRQTKIYIIDDVICE